MPFGPGLLITASCLAGYSYWRFTFRQFAAGIRLERAGSLDQARPLLQAFLRSRSPLSSRAGAKAECRLALARLERRAGCYEQSVAEAGRLLESFPSPRQAVAALLVEADSLAWLGEMDRAQESAAAAIDRAERARLERQGLEGKGLMVRVLTWRGDLEAARRMAVELVRQPPPTSLFARIRLAEIARASGDYASVAKYVQQVVKLAGDAGPEGQAIDRPEVWLALAHYHAARAAWLDRDPERAACWLDNPDALARLPRPEGIAWRGLEATLAAERGKSSETAARLKDLDAAAAGVPPGFGSQAWYHYYRARALFARGDYAAAAEQALEAVHANPPRDSRAEMLYFAGQALGWIDDTRAAAAYDEGSHEPPAYHFTALCASRLVNTGLISLEN
jgi:tetratricopeptide (TPR) repeat protein